MHTVTFSHFGDSIWMIGNISCFMFIVAFHAFGFDAIWSILVTFMRPPFVWAVATFLWLNFFFKRYCLIFRRRPTLIRSSLLWSSPFATVMAFSCCVSARLNILSGRSMSNFRTIVLTRINHTKGKRIAKQRKREIGTMINDFRFQQKPNSDSEIPINLPIRRLFDKITLKSTIDFHTMPLEALQCRTNIDTSVWQMLVHFGSKQFFSRQDVWNPNVRHGSIGSGANKQTKLVRKFE